jgi:hypothetical protein
VFGTFITIGHVCQEIFLIEPTSGASIQKKQGQPPESNKKKGKDLPKKAEKQRHGARSDVQQKLGSGSPRRHGAAVKGKANVLSLTEDARQAWAALLPQLDGSGELITLGEPVSGSTHAEAQEKKGGDRASLRVSRVVVSESLSSPEKSSEKPGSKLTKQSPPKGSLRIVARGSQGKRRSLPVTPRKSPDKVNRMKEGYQQDLETLRQNTLNLNTIAVMSDAIRSADVTQLRAARDESRVQYGELSKRIDRIKKELKAMESQKLVLAGSLKNLDELIAKNPQANFPEDTDWNVIGELPESSGSPAKSSGHHRAWTSNM